MNPRGYSVAPNITCNAFVIFEKLSFHNVFCLHQNADPALTNFFGSMSVFQKLRPAVSVDGSSGLVLTAGLSLQIHFSGVVGMALLSRWTLHTFTFFYPPYNGSFSIAAMATKAYMTARARTTPIKKCVYILLWNFAFTQTYSVWLLVLKLAPAEYATKASSSK